MIINLLELKCFLLVENVIGYMVLEICKKGFFCVIFRSWSLVLDYLRVFKYLNYVSGLIEWF